MTPFDNRLRFIQSIPGVDVVGAIPNWIVTNGAQEPSNIKRVGGTTMTQNRERSIVFGMPRPVGISGLIECFVPPEEIANRVTAQIMPVKDEYDIILARSVGRKAATMLGFGPVEQTKIATAISEIVRNVVIHAGEGTLEIASACRADTGLVGIEILASDTGPGIPDLQQAMRDGFSTGNGLGMGLGGIRRIMDELEIKTELGVGTRVFIRKWRRLLLW